MKNMVQSEGANDVDDVLSSIRKLVSEEARARVAQAQNEASVAPLEATADDTLRLTPAQKVDESPKPLVLENAVPARQPSLIDEDIDLDEAAPFSDEVALRKLVSEMLREELQGELGERITRNVRKLIRREIELALKERS